MGLQFYGLGLNKMINFFCRVYSLIDIWGLGERMFEKSGKGLRVKGEVYNLGIKLNFEDKR